MPIEIKFNNRNQSIAFFSAFGMKNIVAALEEADERERQKALTQEATNTYEYIHELYQTELLKRERNWQALERLGKLKGKAFDRMMRRYDAERKGA